ncbi:non-ribosomal peptide synthetase component E (peptide arylation enzyme) [Paraburkholderia sp. BL23I1N1]|uniref:AMP-binding protein n=1 Tax=Paraburkholderia sp. BL23I1N1 TaxID=1938802 RepID=UPI000E747A7C|nr:AMP-binding protein [Paraburkholderia sp. BL23I1N1]RKE36362.1 non-ribosomal peptide synthetase component E (peptide arylation enzyme) [Paraburkholderia sp. BL23I1N1]
MAGIHFRMDGVAYCDPSGAQLYLSAGAWIDRTFGEALAETARRLPDKLALISDERSITFRELDELSDRLAAALVRLGLERGARAMFQMGTTIDTALALCACYKSGVVPVCSLPQYREVEIGKLADLAQPQAYFVQADLGRFDLVEFAQTMCREHPSFRHLIVARGEAPAGAQSMSRLADSISLSEAKAVLADVRIGSEDVLSFQLSGGTTGVPKIIPRFHAEYLGHSIAWSKHVDAGEHATLIWSLPLLHNAAHLYALVPTIAMGQTTVLMPNVDVVRMAELIEQHRVTHAVSIGPVAPQIMANPQVLKHDFSSLKLFFCLTRADNLQSYIGVPCSNMFGTTEGLLIGSGASVNEYARHHTHGRSGCEHDELVLLDPESETPVPAGQTGELCFRGPSSLRGYYNAPEANASAFTSGGFFRTGDMMRAHVVDGATYFSFEGRLRDNINRGGEKIGAEEVEAFLSHHPAVLDAKLVAMPDPLYGEKGCAFLILRPGQPVPTIPEMIDFLSSKGLAKFKCPERIEVVDEFPVTRVGKVDKPAMRRVIASMLEAESTASAAPSRQEH